jgi:hypothetical protein
MCGDEPKASDGKIGKRQKQADHQEKNNGGHLKRDGTALIREQCRGVSAQDPFSHSITLALP